MFREKLKARFLSDIVAEFDVQLQRSFKTRLTNVDLARGAVFHHCVGCKIFCVCSFFSGLMVDNSRHAPASS